MNYLKLTIRRLGVARGVSGFLPASLGNLREHLVIPVDTDSPMWKVNGRAELDRLFEAAQAARKRGELAVVSAHEPESFDSLLRPREFIHRIGSLDTYSTRTSPDPNTSRHPKNRTNRT